MAGSIQGSLSSNSMINGVLWDGWKWNVSHLNYYFASDFVTWEEHEKTAYRSALDQWSSVTNLTFSEVFTRGEADFVENQVDESQMTGAMGQGAGTFGFHETPDSSTWGVASATNHANIGTNEVNGFYNWQTMDMNPWTANSLKPGGFVYRMMTHELGHALGLKHPFDAFGGVPIFPGVTSSASLGDNNLAHMFYSIMSYNRNYSFNAQGEIVVESGNNIDFPETTADFDYGYVAGPMAFDIAGIQHLYGVKDKNTGDDTYYLPDANTADIAKWLCLWDTGGTDTIAYDGSNGAIIDLAAATLDNSPTGGGALNYARNIYGGFTIANGVVIENASGGGGDDVIAGNEAANFINGNGGDDEIRGLGGNDTLWGGDIDADEIHGGWGFDTVDAGQGDDVVYGDFVGAGNDHLGDADTLKGGGGKDVLNGGGGGDTLYGDFDGFDGRSRDRYALGADRDTLTGGDGSDSLYGGGEADTLDGGDDNDFLLGGDHNDLMLGGAGMDLLDGGRGNDTMHGGAGGDTYFVDSASDKAIETVANESDFVYSTAASFTLGARLEYLTLQGNAYRGTGNDTWNFITGTGKLNLIEGMGGDDFLYGYEFYDLTKGGAADHDVLKGGTGRDHMYGGNGNDSYYVDAADISTGRVTIFELQNEGNDSLYAEANIDLKNDQFIETIYMSKASVKVYGNDFDNRIVGNTTADSIYGRKGNDTLDGDRGNDTVKGDAGNDFIYGDVGNDELYGGAGLDEITGGLGRDEMWGDASKDLFIFEDERDSGVTAATCDQVADFSRAERDRIDLSAFLDRTKLTFTAADAFTGRRGEVIEVASGRNCLVSIDLDADEQADLSILVLNVTRLTAVDFVL